MFDSKTFLYNSVKIDHRTLEKYLKNKKPSLFRFIFSLTPIDTMSVDGLLDLSDIKLLIEQVRKDIKNGELQIKKSKKILAENIKNPKLTTSYDSINACAKYLKGDRYTIRKYLEAHRDADSSSATCGTESKKFYYRKQ